MLDISLIREKPEWVKEQIGKLYDSAALERIDGIVELDTRRRELLKEVEALKGYRNRMSKSAGRVRGDKQTDLPIRLGLVRAVIQAVEAQDYGQASDMLEMPHVGGEVAGTDADFENAMNTLFSLMKALGDRISQLDESVREVDTQLDEQMLWIPNLPHASVPVFESDTANIPHAEQGTHHFFDFDPKPHWELGPELGIIDFERGVKLAGARFYILNGMGARLLRALSNFLLDELTTNEGFTELYVPHMLKEHAMYGSGQFPKFVDTSYKIEGEELYMIPTSEVAIVNMFGGEILDGTQFPLYYCSRTPCFRQEKMSGGRDVRGIKRVHQFEKVEMIKFTTAETSYDELEKMVQTAERLCEKLEIPYRRLEIVTGDLGFSATKKYDIETYAPGCQEWLEISSCSNCEDFQSHRANIKYRVDGKTHFAHTLNGSAFGMVRMIIAILENFQTADGSVVVPNVLRPYMGGLEIITKA